jgi:hypothetical protein
MVLRRALSLVLASGLAAGALVLAAAPARAATYTVDLVVAANCSATSSLNLPGVLNPGDVITISPSGPGVGLSTTCAVTLDGTSGNTTGWFDLTGGGNIDMSGFTGLRSQLTTSQSLVFQVGSADATIFTEPASSLTPSPNTMIATWAATGGGFTSRSSSSSSSTDPGPAPVVQQFGRPASGTCADAAPITLNWGGASSGGWSESWAQWMNSGNGGAVCTRTLSYSAGAWSAG